MIPFENPLTSDWFGASGLGDRLVAFIDSPQFPPIAFAVAFVAGAAHAVGPGHGKSLAAAYLAGSDGKIRDAAWLGGSVAIMHTLSVFVLAVAWTFFDLSGLIELKTLTTTLQLVAGVIVIATGVWLIRRHLSGRAQGRPHSRGGVVHTHGGIAHAHGGATHTHGADTHAHGEAAHGHEGHTHGDAPAKHTHPHDHKGQHDHDHDHDHQHTAPSRPGLALLGMSGGLTPSPSAFLLLVTGLFSGRSGLALALVVVFGLGLASVLFGVGLLAIAGKSVVVRTAQSRTALRLATRVAPAIAAVSITFIGCALTVSAATTLVTAS